MGEGTGKIDLMVFCDGYHEEEGDDRMVLLAVRYALRGLAPSFPTTARRDMTPEEIRTWINAAGPTTLVVVVLDAKPPTREEARAMDAAYYAATSPAGAAELPARYSDDWIWEIGPKSFAAITAAQARGLEPVVMMPPCRAQALAGAEGEAAGLIEDAAAREQFVLALSFRLRCGEASVRVPARALADRPENVVSRLFRLMDAAEAEAAK